MIHPALKGNSYDDYEALLSNEMEAAAPLKVLSVGITFVGCCNKAVLIAEKQTVMMIMPTKEYTVFQLRTLQQHIAVP